MGMSASQARFLSLTARKTNTEFEGQQINQQRTTLSNESANYYSMLASMTVPTPPSSSDFSKTVYTFTDGSEHNTINSLIALSNGTYILNYTSSVETESVVSNGNVIVTRSADGEDYKYMVGSTPLRVMNTSTKAEDIDAYIAQYGNTDPYLKTISSEEDKRDVLYLEAKYAELLKNKYNQNDWYVRYQKNSSSGAFEPIFYSKDQVERAHYDEETGASQTTIKSLVYGVARETREVRNMRARVEQDTSGRYMSITVYKPDEIDEAGNIKEDAVGVHYDLTTTTEADDAAYNDAMNKYNYEKAQYDQAIQEVNSKIEIIQTQDKNLELKLKQLDTEQNAIQTEMEAVKKVISKNVEQSFKTFEA